MGKLITGVALFACIGAVIYLGYVLVPDKAGLHGTIVTASSGQIYRLEAGLGDTYFLNPLDTNVVRLVGQKQ